MPVDQPKHALENTDTPSLNKVPRRSWWPFLFTAVAFAAVTLVNYYDPPWSLIEVLKEMGLGTAASIAGFVYLLGELTVLRGQNQYLIDAAENIKKDEELIGARWEHLESVDNSLKQRDKDLSELLRLARLSKAAAEETTRLTKENAIISLQQSAEATLINVREVLTGARVLVRTGKYIMALTMLDSLFAGLRRLARSPQYPSVARDALKLRDLTTIIMAFEQAMPCSNRSLKANDNGIGKALMELNECLDDFADLLYIKEEA